MKIAEETNLLICLSIEEVSLNKLLQKKWPHDMPINAVGHVTCLMYAFVRKGEQVSLMSWSCDQLTRVDRKRL